MTTLDDQARSVFLAALECAPEQWPALVNEACDGNTKLRARVDQLLHAHQASGSIHGGPAAIATTDEPITQRLGAVIGPYKLMEQIGEGGMGLVYVAEQQQPVNRRVALKIIKPGMDSRQVIARFEAERQALAMMEHPNIAKVFDGGTTPEGRPYFVMEFVRGRPITEYCDAHLLTTRQRLELFLDVCHAVQHAHQKGIIHRDLKPSNVLVSHHDVRAVVKVIDFGVAKATGQRLTGRTVYTVVAQMIGTPTYMSPEQAGLSDLDVDTRCDVYSLGVLLYELLTGTTPFDQETLKTVSYDEMRRMIREDEPPRPSTRLNTLGSRVPKNAGSLNSAPILANAATAEAMTTNLATIAAQRKSDPKRLSQMLRGELDWIAMKALEKDRGRRYESASAFAADVQRYLDDEPVQACPPSAGYRFRKFARRNKAMLTTMAAVAVALLLGTGISVWQAVEANYARGLAGERLEDEKRAHIDAEEQRQRAQASYGKAREAVKKMLQEVGDEQVSAIPEMQKIRLRLLEDAVTFYTELIPLNPDDAQTYYERAKVYFLIAKPQRARADLEKAIELDPDNAELHSMLAFAIRWGGSWIDEEDLQRILFHAKRAAELQPTIGNRMALAEAYGRQQQVDQALAEYQKAAELAPDTTEAHRALADAALLRGDLQDARAHYEKAVELSRLARLREGGWESARTMHVWTYIHLARVLRYLGDDAHALTVLNRSLELVGVSGHARAGALYDRAQLYANQGKFEAAQVDYETAMQLDPAPLLWALVGIAETVELKPDDVSNIPETAVASCSKEKFRQGIVALADQTIARLQAQPDIVEGGEAEAYALRARLSAALNQPERARADFERAFTLYEHRLEKRKAKLGPDHVKTLFTMCQLIEIGAKAGKLNHAEGVLADLLEGLKRKEGPKVPDSRLAQVGATLGHTLLGEHRYAEAEPVLRECLMIRTEKMPENWLHFNAMSMLGGALLGQKKYTEAEPLLLQGYEGMKKRENQIPPGGRTARLPEAAERLARLFEATNQPEKAREWREKAKVKPPAAADMSLKAPAEKPATPAAEKCEP